MRTLAILSLSLLLSTPASAVDGVLEINQTCAVSTGCFSGDAAGFPVTIDRSAGSSYRLTSDLTVADENLAGIALSADGVTIDLNGFEIAGPVTCTGLGSAVSCTPVGTGDGIEAPGRLRVTVRDGRVRGFADRGVLLGGRAQVRNVVVASNGGIGITAAPVSVVGECTAYQNGSNGIVVGSSSVVRGSTAVSNGNNGIHGGPFGATVVASATRDNGGVGIYAATGGVVRDSTAINNEDDGIQVLTGGVASDCSSGLNGGDGIESSFGATVQRNSVRANTGFGLNLVGGDVTYRENTVTANTGGTVNGGVNMGDNSCNGTATCP